MSTCPFCKRDPYEYVDVGFGGGAGWGAAVAITCCDMGIALYHGDKKVKQALRFMRDPSPRRKARAARIISEYQ